MLKQCAERVFFILVFRFGALHKLSAAKCTSKRSLQADPSLEHSGICFYLE